MARASKRRSATELKQQTRPSTMADSQTGQATPSHKLDGARRHAAKITSQAHKCSTCIKLEPRGNGRHDGRQTKKHSRRSESAIRNIHAIDVDRDRRNLFRTPLPPRTNESIPLIEEFLRLLSIAKHRASHAKEIISRDEEHQLMRTPTAAQALQSTSDQARATPRQRRARRLHSVVRSDVRGEVVDAVGPSPRRPRVGVITKV